MTPCWLKRGYKIWPTLGPTDCRELRESLFHSFMVMFKWNCYIILNHTSNLCHWIIFYFLKTEDGEKRLRARSRSGKKCEISLVFWFSSGSYKIWHLQENRSRAKAENKWPDWETVRASEKLDILFWLGHLYQLQRIRCVETTDTYFLCPFSRTTADDTYGNVVIFGDENCLVLKLFWKEYFKDRLPIHHSMILFHLYSNNSFESSPSKGSVVFTSLGRKNKIDKCFHNETSNFDRYFRYHQGTDWTSTFICIKFSKAENSKIDL